MKKLFHILIYVGLIVSLLLRLIWIEIRSEQGLTIQDPYLTPSYLSTLCASNSSDNDVFDKDKAPLRAWAYKFLLKTGCRDNEFSLLEYFYHSQGILVFILLLCAYLCRFFSGSWTLPLVSAIFILSRGRISSIPYKVSDTILMMALCSLWATSLAFWLRTGASKVLILYFLITTFLVALEPRMWGLGISLFMFLLILRWMHSKKYILVSSEHIQERSLDERMGIQGLWQLLGMTSFDGSPNKRASKLSQGNYFDWLQVSFFEWLAYGERRVLFIKYSAYLAIVCFIIAQPWLDISNLIYNWNVTLVSKKFTQLSQDYLSFFDLDWRFFFIFIMFHIFIKRTYISLKEFSLVFSISLVFAYLTTLIGMISDWLVIDLSKYVLTDLSYQRNVEFLLWFEPVIITLLTIYSYSLLSYLFRILSSYLKLLKSEYYSLRGLK